MSVPNVKLTSGFLFQSIAADLIVFSFDTVNEDWAFDRGQDEEEWL